MGKTSKDKRDIYYRMAKQEGWRARSAFKLKQVDDMFNIFEKVSRVVDLCAAPGSWSQVVSKELLHNPEREQTNTDDVKIVAVDLQPMSPLPGVIQLQGDITELSTAENIISHFDGKKAHLVICDGAPDVTGLHAFDEYLQSQLVFAAFNITTHILEIDGTFVSKIFRAKNADLLYAQMRLFFKEVHCCKPRSSRQSSCEAFIVCKHYSPPPGYVPNLKNPVLAENYDECVGNMQGVNRVLVPFMACGDLTGFSRCKEYDSDRNYSLHLNGQEYTYHEPVQMPTNPAYSKACQLRRSDQLCKVDGKNEHTEVKADSSKLNEEMNTSNDQSASVLEFVNEIEKLIIE
ncbi:ftsJ-like methyltransferase domain-containing protein [Ditylenchus destructor]|nr:ftsJ-like methyltransferase domain-containing protein [Ditylenchus destructor]